MKIKYFAILAQKQINRIISDDFDLSEQLISLFEHDVRSLIIKPHKSYISDLKDIGEPIEITIKKFENYPKCSRY